MLSNVIIFLEKPFQYKMNYLYKNLNSFWHLEFTSKVQVAGEGSQDLVLWLYRPEFEERRLYSCSLSSSLSRSRLKY